MAKPSWPCGRAERLDLQVDDYETVLDVIEEQAVDDKLSPSTSKRRHARADALGAVDSVCSERCDELVELVDNDTRHVAASG